MIAFYARSMFIDLRASKQDKPPGHQIFSDDRSELSPTGHNAYFILEPGYSLVLIEGDEHSSSPFWRNEKGPITSNAAGWRNARRKPAAGRGIQKPFFGISKRTNNVYTSAKKVDM